MATYAENETVTRIRFSFQLTTLTGEVLATPWNVFGSMGIIPSAAAATSPPARPQSSPNDDRWLWLEPLVWQPGFAEYANPSATTPTQVVQTHAIQRDVRAQRKGEAGGSKLWAVWQWSPPVPLPTNTYRRRAWFSIGVLEA